MKMLIFKGHLPAVLCN